MATVKDNYKGTRLHRLALFYWRFTPQFSTIIAPITACLRSGSFSWTKEAKEPFEEVKRRLTNAHILVLPKFNVPFELHANALKIGIRAILSQDR